eukprot:3547225-Prymnesium_polylepis.1
MDESCAAPEEQQTTWATTADWTSHVLPPPSTNCQSSCCRCCPPRSPSRARWVAAHVELLDAGALALGRSQLLGLEDLNGARLSARAARHVL